MLRNHLESRLPPVLVIDKCQYKCYIAGVSDVSPSFLLDHPELVEPAAPWCVWLDNLELGVLLLAQPWIGGGGLHRADIERRLGRLGDADLPIGPVYFQRVNRAVAALESRGQLAGEGAGRRRAFVITPQGFAALILNLQVLRADPTVDGSEFELKRALVAMWNLVLERLVEWAEKIDLGPEMSEMFEGLDRLEVWGQTVITARVVADAFNILRLIGVQGEHVQKLRRAAELKVEQTNGQADMSRGAELSRLLQSARLAKQRRTAATTVETVRGLAAGTMPQLEASTQIARYTAYLRYLESLAGLYSRELKVVDVSAFRSALARRTA